jgi:hypothetical protein
MKSLAHVAFCMTMANILLSTVKERLRHCVCRVTQDRIKWNTLVVGRN